jgi:predicted tellurium resistance membrane protein TerC
MEWLSDPQTWIAFLTLVALELVLGVDNVIFISILSAKLPFNQQSKARKTGIGLAISHILQQNKLNHLKNPQYNYLLNL